MYSDGRYLLQISLPFHQVFFTVLYWETVLRIIANLSVIGEDLQFAVGSM